ncbi:MAG: hypothetical protein KGH84_02930 [Paracoccaceae bacterium]|nr:hypothetical protein [Paracoccaceae bacterium]
MILPLLAGQPGAGAAILPDLSGTVAALPVPDPVYTAEPVLSAFERPEPQGRPPKHAHP